MTAVSRICRRPRWRGGEDGSAAVELVITLSLFALFILGITEFGVALYNWNTMQLAIARAGRYVMINNTTITPAIAEAQMRVILTSAAVCSSPSPGQICVNASTAPGAPSTITLTAIYNFNVLALAGSFTLRSQATFPLD